MAGNKDPLFEKTIELFKQQHNSAIARILKRAEEREARQAKISQRQFERTLRHLNSSRMGKILNKALTTQGRAVKNQESIRLRAPGTNATSFHFAQTTINKTDLASKQEGSGKKDGSNGQGKTGSSKSSGSSAAAHQNYIERETAVEQDAQEIDIDGKIIKKENEKEQKEGSFENNVSEKETENTMGNVSGNESEQNEFWKKFEKEYPEDEIGEKPYETIKVDLSSEKNKEAMKAKLREMIQEDMEDFTPVTVQIKDKGKDEEKPYAIIKRSKTMVPTVKTENGTIEWSFIEEENRLKKIEKEKELEKYKKMKARGSNLSFGNIGDTPEQRKKFWKKFEKEYPEDEHGGEAYEVIKIPLNRIKNIKKMTEAVAKRIHEDLASNTPVWATIRTPETDKRTTVAHAVIIRAKTSLPTQTNEKTGETEWVLTANTRNDPPNKMEAVRKEVDRRLSPEAPEAPDVQSYIEDKTKLSPLHGTTASFGTLGSTIEERRAFWEKTIKEEAINGRVQNRLIVELPHQASAEAHYKIVQRFTEEFRKKNIPFWVAIHQPTKENDQRNFHAHIIFGDRPTQKRLDESTGKMEWDFAIKKTIVRSNRSTREIKPYKQNKLKEMTSKDFIPNMRKKYSETVNQVMAEYGLDVRYDPRSYQAMGLSEKPMANVNRIVADKMKRHKFVVMDSDWTRRQINIAIKKAAAERSASWIRLNEIEKNIRDSAIRFTDINRQIKISPQGRKPSSSEIYQAKHNELMTLEHLKLERQKVAKHFADEAAIRAIQKIIEATETKSPFNRELKVADPSIKNEDLEKLNLAAKTELKELLNRIKKENEREERRQRDIEKAPRTEEWLDQLAGGPALTKEQIKERKTKIVERDLDRDQDPQPEEKREKLRYSDLAPIPQDVFKRMNQMADELIMSGVGPETMSDFLTAQVRASRGMREVELTGGDPLSIVDISRSVLDAQKKGASQVTPPPHERRSPDETVKPVTGYKARNKTKNNNEEKTHQNPEPDKENKKPKREMTPEQKKRRKRKMKQQDLDI